MTNYLNIARTISILLITLMLTGFRANPEPEPDQRSNSFVSVFDNKRKRADRYFNNFEYKSAIKLYNKLVEKGKADDLVKLRLAESYLKINDPINAEKWFAEVIHSHEVTPQHQIQYAHTLLSNGKYEQAREVISSYEFAESDYRSQAIMNTLDRLEIFYSDSSFYYVNPIEENKPQYSDFSPTTFKNGIVFVSSRTNKGPKFKWDETPFLDLYYTETDVASARPFSEKLNSKYHEGPITFYDDYTKAIFTRSNYLDKEFGVNEAGINNLQLYTATWNEETNDWDQIEPVNFVIKNYSYGHPSITADNQKLYFVSDMPGGYGGTDIYLSERTETGWGDPVNMGEVINTASNEMYPFIDDENNLYFASNGHGGLGGLDVFQIQLDGPMDLRNMGYPLNTTADDFGFSLNQSGDLAYVSSNREGVDNIYQVDIQAPDLEMILADNSVNGEAPSLDEIQPMTTSELATISESDLDDELSTINTSIIDENNEALMNADLKLLVDGEEMHTMVSDESGKISLQVEPYQDYTLIASKEGFEDRVITLPAESLGQQEDLLIVMNSILVDTDFTEDEVPTTELDPLAVSDDPWEDSSLDSSERPEINGVALQELPDWQDSDSEELPTTELDPLAVSDDGWNESNLEQDNRPAINGVALTGVPEFEESQDVDNYGQQEDLPTTELDPLAVSDDGWNESSLEQNDRPAINGVALAAVPEFEESQDVDNFSSDDNQDIATTELDPLAVSDDGWNESSLEQNDRPAINGVALADAPEFEESQDVDNFSSDDNQDIATTELDPLAVSDDGWNESSLEQNDRPAINGVALADVPEFDDESQNTDYSDDNSGQDGRSTTSPLAVTNEGWNNSDLGDNNSGIEGVARCA